MGTLGDVLEALYDAPRTNRAVHILARQMVDQTVIPRIHEWWVQQQQGDGAWSTGVLMTASDGERADVVETTNELRWLGPDRWRTDAGDFVAFRTPDASYTYYPRTGGMRKPEPDGLMPPWSSVLEARWVLRAFDLDVVGASVVVDRACWSLALRSAPSPMNRGMPHLIAPWLGQVCTCEVDQETGIVLAVEGRFEGEVCATWTTTRFELPETIDPAVLEFVPPDGADFRDPREFHIESMLRLAAERDIDLSGVDIEDQEELGRVVMSAIHGRSFSNISPEERAAQYVPTGPLPADPDAAEAQVRDAFERIVTPSDDGESVPAVEGGANLGPALREAGTRAPGGADVPATVRVEYVKFLDSDEAVVWFSLDRGGQTLLPGVEGRARRIDDRWLVARATFAQLVGSIGVRCPPPPDS